MGAEQPPAKSVETREPVAVKQEDGEVDLLRVYLNEEPNDGQHEEHQGEGGHATASRTGRAPVNIPKVRHIFSMSASSRR